MKKYFSLFLAILLTFFLFSGCSKQNQTKTSGFNTISTEELKDKINDSQYVIVDTRINDAFNGWKLDGVKRGGHIPNAVDFSANWLKVDVKDKEKILDDTLKSKNITPDKNIVLYDANGKDAIEVANYLKSKGYNNIYIYDIKQWANDDSLPLEKFKNYHLIVPAAIVKDILDGKKPETFENAKTIKIVEASWGEEKDSYAKGHVPTSFHINTDLVEPPPAWMLASDKELEKFALDYGFTKDDTVIVTGENPMAAYRVAVVLRYMGVNDVRVLNGGLLAWKLAGYEVETKSNKPTPVKEFGAPIPGRPELIDTIDEVKAGMKKPDEFMLVDNRTWEEYIGKSSGYSYHHKKGRIPTAVYGYAGIGDSNSLQYYRNIDGTMRNGYEILALWKKAGIDTSKHLSLYCGSGWRVSEIMTYANVLGIDNISIYSNGWIEWSNNNNEYETGEPKK
ncbi:rhodanese-like domain-containing protein [Caloramator sp. CAR-1]|uniref:sulfurtransferase n=1 Tax=Caloramator sp. CAR-1 TaxID=3062777 RepID=UPI0026E1F301|nr:rhodanese-like domain-containing protein [Caloramator sp. CAR-1]MDO6356020.1 rhodanese-like domain-containing protein [Caloramator sp. CAR-1]